MGDRARFPLKFRPCVLITASIVVADTKVTKTLPKTTAAFLFCPPPLPASVFRAIPYAVRREESPHLNFLCKKVFKQNLDPNADEDEPTDDFRLVLEDIAKTFPDVGTAK